MPIDLKWVRSDPDQVREWQNLRKRRAPKCDDGSVRGAINEFSDNDVVATTDLIDDVLHKDELSRKNLQTLQEHKKSLKQFQVRLRPKKTTRNHNTSGSEAKGTNNDAIKEQNLDNKKDNRESLLIEKKAMETKIRLAEVDWKASLEDTHKTLCKLASPVTTSTRMKQNGNGDDNVYNYLDANQVHVMPIPFSLPFSGARRSSLGMDLEQAWRQYTLRHFAAYLWVEMPRGMPVVEEILSDNPSNLSDFSSINLDRAHELWGCFLPCDNTSPNSRSSSSNANHQSVAILPSWIRLLTEYLPNKSIWGEKELPRYTAILSSRSEQRSDNDALWLGGPKQYNHQAETTREQDSSGVLASGSSLELAAVMAPSVVDAREIQNKFVQEVLTYYDGVLMPNQKNLLKCIVVPAPDLHNHERSRIEIHLLIDLPSSDCSTHQGGSKKLNTLRLGWVSHWGDAATRACDMAFAGGGVVQAGGKKKYGKSSRNASKEYIHLVEASVIDDFSLTWKKILYANSNIDAASTDGTDLAVNMPPVLAPYLVRPISDSLSVPMKDLFVDEKDKKKKKESFFGVLGDRNDYSLNQKAHREPLNSCNSSGVETAREGNSTTRNAPKFPPFRMASFMSKDEIQKRVRLEKLSCPYDFLFE